MSSSPMSPSARRLPGMRSALLQLALLVAVFGLLAWLIAGAGASLKARGLASGFGFLDETAGFPISEGLVPYDVGDSYFQALLAGIGNTIRAAVPAMVLSTVLGFLVGVMQISRHPLLRLMGRTYVGIVCNVPLLIQVLLWYFLFTEGLPRPDRPMQWGDLAFLSNAGLSVIAPTGQAGLWWLTSAALVCGVTVVVWPLFRWGRGRLLLVTALAAVAWLGLPLQWERPAVGSFGVHGGATLSIEWLALVCGLSFYTASYCAEIVRAGLEAVPVGQWQAAQALGLSWLQALRRVVLPQSLRVMVPPYTSTLMSTLKNSSLAVMVGYPDVVAVATTTMNQTGQAIECVALIAAVYLLLNLVTALVMGWVNSRVQIKER